MNNGYRWFYNRDNIKTLNASEMDTYFLTNLSQCFADCEKLKSLNIANWRTNWTTDMSRMFENSKVVSLDLDKWNTANVVNFSSQFINCKNMVDIKMNNFDMSNIKNVSNMFSNCGDINYGVNLYMTNWKFDLNKSYDLSSLFQDCYDGTRGFKDIENWNVSVKNMSNIFKNTKFNNINLIKNWNLNNASLDFAFAGTKINNVGTENFWKNISNKTSIVGLFENCTNLETLNCLNYIMTNNLSAYSYLFANCYNLDENSYNEIANLGERTPISLSHTFEGHHNITNLNFLSNWNLSSLRNIDFMFANCTNLNDISILENLDATTKTPFKSSANGLFAGCHNLTDFSVFNTWINYYPTMFYKTFANQTSNFNYQNAALAINFNSQTAQSISYMFENSQFTYASLSFLNGLNFPKIMGYRLEGLYSNTNSTYFPVINLPTVTTYSEIFKGSKITTPIFPFVVYNYRPIHIDGLFRNCQKITNGFWRGVNSNGTDLTVQTAYNIFDNCQNLNSVSLTLNFSQGGGLTGPLVVNCPNLTSAYFNIGNIQYPAYSTWPVGNCNNLKSLTIELSRMMATSSYPQGLFMSKGNNCKSLESLALRIINTSGQTQFVNLYGFFSGLTNLKTANVFVSGVNVTSADNLYAGCSNLTTQPALPTASNMSASYAYSNCSNLTNISLGFSYPIGRAYCICDNCTNLTDASISGVVAPYGAIGSPFINCPNLVNLNLGLINVSNYGAATYIVPNTVTNLTISGKIHAYGGSNISNFYGGKASALGPGAMGGFLLYGPADMSNLFCNGMMNNFSGSTIQVTTSTRNLAFMFYNCRYLNTNPFSSMSFTGVTDVSGMIGACNNLAKNSSFMQMLAYNLRNANIPSNRKNAYRTNIYSPIYGCNANYFNTYSGYGTVLRSAGWSVPFR